MTEEYGTGMTEPLYEFVKGKGWQVASPYPTFYTVDRSGRSIRLIERTPLPGESWIYKTPEYGRDGKEYGGINGAIDHFKSFAFESAPIAPGVPIKPGRYYQSPGDMYPEHYVVELV